MLVSLNYLLNSLLAIISLIVVCFKNAMSPASNKHLKAPSNPEYGSR